MEYDLRKKAKLRCMHLLEKRDYTEKQLRDKLRMGKTPYSEEIISEAIDYVKSYHYVDDERYARNYVEQMSQRKSHRQIEQDLLQKGVDRAYIASAFEDTKEGDEMQLIFQWMEKKHFDRSTADQKECQKMYAFLLRKGFQSSDVSRAMRVSIDENC